MKPSREFVRKSFSRIRSFLWEREGVLWPVGIIIVVVMGGISSWQFWDKLTDTMESLSTTIRNVALVIGGVAAILLAVWRSRVAERQAATSQQGLLNERYQKGAEMLGSSVLAVRLGGIYALRRLAEEHPAHYHILVMQLLCAFVRHPTGKNVGDAASDRVSMSSRIREDVQAIMEFIGSRGDAEIKLEQQNSYLLDLTGAYLKDLSLEKGNLSYIRFAYADLTGAYLMHADLSNTRLTGANLSVAVLTFAKLQGGVLRWANLTSAKLSKACLYDAVLDEADLSIAELHGAVMSGASLLNTILSGADLSFQGQDPVIGLTQVQLDCTRADEDELPDLTRVVDAETGLPLVWSGRPLD